MNELNPNRKAAPWARAAFYFIWHDSKHGLQPKIRLQSWCFLMGLWRYQASLLEAPKNKAFSDFSTNRTENGAKGKNQLLFLLLLMATNKHKKRHITWISSYFVNVQGIWFQPWEFPPMIWEPKKVPFFLFPQLIFWYSYLLIHPNALGKVS